MSKHIGGTFDDFLKEEGIYEEVTALAKAKSKALKLPERNRHNYALLHDTAMHLSDSTMALIAEKKYKKASDLFLLASRYEEKAVAACPDKLERTKKILRSSLDALKFKAKKYKALANKPKKKKKH